MLGFQSRVAGIVLGCIIATVFLISVFGPSIKNRLATENSEAASQNASTESPEPDSPAEVALKRGIQYSEGDGVSKDSAEALFWYRRAADLGNVAAMIRVGHAYFIGDGTSVNYLESFQWYRRAAESTDEAAMFSVGVFYENGYGVKKDVATAKAWYEKAAEAGYQDAKDALERIKKKK